MHLSAIDSEATMTLFRMKMIFSEIKVLLWLTNVLEDNVAERTARALLQSCFVSILKSLSGLSKYGLNAVVCVSTQIVFLLFLPQWFRQIKI